MRATSEVTVHFIAAQCVAIKHPNNFFSFKRQQVSYCVSSAVCFSVLCVFYVFNALWFAAISVSFCSIFDSSVSCQFST